MSPGTMGSTGSRTTRSLSQKKVIFLFSPRACASKPPCGSCRCSSLSLTFDDASVHVSEGLGRRVAPQSMRVGCEYSGFHHFTDPLRVLLALVLPLSDFPFWLLLRVANGLYFWFLWILRSSLFRLLRSVESFLMCAHAVENPSRKYKMRRELRRILQ